MMKKETVRVAVKCYPDRSLHSSDDTQVSELCLILFTVLCRTHTHMLFE